MNWEEVRQEYESTDITLKALAEKYDVKDSTLRSRKNRENWQRNENATQRNEKTKSVATKKPRYPNGHPGNKNPKNKFTERNQAAFKHGLFSRYMPKETLKIMGMVAGADPVDLLWMQIELQFAAIIRAQEIMFVESKDEMIKELKKRKDTEWGEEIEYEFQFAWDRHASFLNSQTKALSELRASIKQFVEMADDTDERRLRLEVMQQQLRKLERENNDERSVESKLEELFDKIEGVYRDAE